MCMCKGQSDRFCPSAWSVALAKRMCSARVMCSSELQLWMRLEVLAVRHELSIFFTGYVVSEQYHSDPGKRLWALKHTVFLLKIKHKINDYAQVLPNSQRQIFNTHTVHILLPFTIYTCSDLCRKWRLFSIIQ